MGAQNVALVYARWGALNHAPFRVLAYMALRSLDSGNPPVFYAGRDEIALALGKPYPDAGPDFEKKRKANWESAKKVIAELSKAGAVSLSAAAGNRQNAVYELNLNPIGISYPQEAGGKRLPPTGGKPAPRQVGNLFPQGGKPVPPLGGEGVLGVIEGTTGEGNHGPAPSAHTREDEKPDEISGMAASEKPAHSEPDCPTCSTVLDPDGSCFVCRTAPRRKGMYA